MLHVDHDSYQQQSIKVIITISGVYPMSVDIILGCVSVCRHMSVTLVSDRSTWAVGCVLYVLTCQLHWSLTGRLGQ